MLLPPSLRTLDAVLYCLQHVFLKGSCLQSVNCWDGLGGLLTIFHNAPVILDGPVSVFPSFLQCPGRSPPNRNWLVSFHIDLDLSCTHLVSPGSVSCCYLDSPSLLSMLRFHISFKWLVCPQLIPFTILIFLLSPGRLRTAVNERSNVSILFLVQPHAQHLRLLVTCQRG